MTLSALIRKRDTGNLATAIPAIFATQPKGEAATVARIATVAVANPKGEAATVARIATVAVANPTERKTAHAANVGAGDTATAPLWWLIRYPDRAPEKVAYSPEPTHAEILARHPDAVAVEPFTPTIRQPSAPLTASEETAIRALLARRGETDPALIADALHRCQQDAVVRALYIGQAVAELPKPDPFPDDRRA